ncbi:MAG: type 4a pilus biogenesis protein PilO [Thermoleophilia bacterium]|nr:type 4a pilus biogenesis protein PilO [Thermoleophilia bacterium]
MSRKLKMILAGVVVVIVAALVWFFLLSPIRDDIQATETQIEDERTRLSQAQIELAQAEATREEGKANQARLMELAKMMPETEEIPSLLLQLQDLADQSGITFIAISPGDTQSSDQADGRILPLDLEFRGTFFNVSDFIYRAEQMVAGPGRLLAVKTLDLSMGGAAELQGGVSPELGVSLQLYAFLAGSGEAPASAAPPAATETTEEKSE